MVVGLFMSEIGTDLLRFFAAADPEIGALRGELGVEHGWAEKEFARVCDHLGRHAYTIDPSRLDYERLRNFLNGKRELLLRLLENPNLLEHEAFTDLLRAVFHLKEELQSRPGFGELPESDLKHISNDAKRAYPLLVQQWIDYLHYLRDNFGYLYSLAVRTNPFSHSASPVVRS